MSGKLPERKPLRLKGYDYSRGGTYFITICTHQHQCTLGRISSVGNRPLRVDERRSELSKVVGYLKMNASRDIRTLLPLTGVWQRGYHDHIVRDENDFLRIWTYIKNNPLKWELDRYYLAP